MSATTLIEDQQLVPDVHAFGDHGTGAGLTSQSATVASRCRKERRQRYSHRDAKNCSGN
jgi:hypothetical protein